MRRWRKWKNYIYLTGKGLYYAYCYYVTITEYLIKTALIFIFILSLRLALLQVGRGRAVWTSLSGQSSQKIWLRCRGSWQFGGKRMWTTIVGREYTHNSNRYFFFYFVSLFRGSWFQYKIIGFRLWVV